MAFLTESVLDLEDPEACEYAAEIVQSQEEAYNAGQNKGAQWLPRAALRALWELHPPPEASQVAGAEGQDDLQKLRGDAVCPLQKGKGKGRDRPPGAPRALRHHLVARGRPQCGQAPDGLLIFHTRGHPSESVPREPNTPQKID